MRLSPQALILAFFLMGCSDKPAPVNYDPQTARAKLAAALPNGWTAIDANWQQRPETTSYFNHPRTEAFMLVGPQSRHGYSDSRGQQHRDDIYKECIFVWIVPGDFNPTFPQLPPSNSVATLNLFS